MRPASGKGLIDSGKKTIILPRDRASIRRKFVLLKANQEFRKEVARLRSLKSGNNEIPALLKKFNLSREWAYLITVFIDTNIFEMRADPKGVRIDIDPKSRFATFKVFPETTLQELRRAHRHIIEMLKGGKNTRNRKHENNNRNAWISELRSGGESYKKIGEMVYEVYGEHLDMGHLKQIVHRMKKSRES